MYYYRADIERYDHLEDYRCWANSKIVNKTTHYSVTVFVYKIPPFYSLFCETMMMMISSFLES